MINSKENIGTIVTVTLPLAKPPEWYLEQFRLTAGLCVVTVGEVESIHEIGSFLQTAAIGSKVPLERHSFSTVSELESWFKDDLSTLCLLLLDDRANWRSLQAKSLGQGSQVILVTSNGCASGRQEAGASGFKVIPQVLISAVPLEIEKPHSGFENVQLADSAW